MRSFRHPRLFAGAYPRGDDSSFWITVFILVFSVYLIQPAILHADDRGTRAAAFLKSGIGARGVAMGGAYSAVAAGVESLYWNPAGLVGIHRPSLMFSYNPLVEGVQNAQAALGWKMGQVGFGFGFNGVLYDSIDELNDVGNKIGSFKASDQLTLFGLALPINGLNVGVNGKWIRSEIDDVSGETFAFDAGLCVQNPFLKRLTHSITGENIGGDLKFLNQADPLPTRYVLGNLFTVHERFLVALDGGRMEGVGGIFMAGFDWKVVVNKENVISLRGGYTNQRNKIDGLSGASVGFGLGLKALTMDYAWVPFGELGDAHALTLIWRVPRFRGFPRSSMQGSAGLRKAARSAIEFVTLTLANGKSMDGILIRETRKNYVVKSNGRTFNISKDEVIQIQQRKPLDNKRMRLSP